MAPTSSGVISGLVGSSVTRVADQRILRRMRRYLAEDACQLIEVEYDPLPAVASIEQALDPARPPLFEEAGDNIAYTSSATAGDLDAAFARADRVIKETFRQHRYANVPMETRGAVASYNQATGELLYHGAVQAPQVVRFFLAKLLNLPVHRVRVINGDIGGAFGLKAGVYREDV